MKTSSTLNTLLISLLSAFFFLSLSFSVSEAVAQKWSGVNGNEWLEGKYTQPWAKILVGTKGIQRVLVSDLPEPIKSADKNRYELWHRGVQVSIIKADATEILFYGVPNDGASDAWLYRPMETRRNPYYSIYSDKSAYFLTVNPTTNGNRAVTPTVVVNPSADVLQYHIKTDLKIYANEYSHSTANFYRAPTFNSYFEDGKQATGSGMLEEALGSAIQTSNPKPYYLAPATPFTSLPFSFSIKFPFGVQPKKVTVHIKGRLGNSTADIYVGKNAANLRAAGPPLSVADFNDYDYSFDLQDTDYDAATGAATLGFKSTRTGAEGSGFSVSYFTVEYQQALNMQSLTSYEFEFPAAASGSQSNIAITGAPANTVVYDISNIDVPRILTNTPAGFNVDRNGQKLKLLAASVTVPVAAGSISTPVFQDINPASYDYLIIAGDALNSSANTYANYRKTISPGKKYKPIVKNISQIYDQFNYGEPSPVGIRRFVDFMISDNNKDKFLLLIGTSVTYFERQVREIPGEVPTVGFPGADLLLVDGLKGTKDDVPTIPVGRIAAISDDQVLGYLDKITKYENQAEVSWRKNVVHMNGGKTDDEVAAFAGFLAGIGSKVTSSPFSGKIILKPKTSTATTIVEMTLAPQVNGTDGTGAKGVGFISYFGHGSVDQTDYNAGYAGDNRAPASGGKGYNNPNYFPVMFYNGCGVNNIFSGRSGLFGTSPAGLVRPMSLDWLLIPNKGAVIVFGNTWDAFPDNSNDYLDRLYPYIFSYSDAQRKTIGQILQAVASDTKDLRNYQYSTAGIYNIDRANAQQILLQGDPALRILVTAAALPVKLISFEAVNDKEQVRLDWKTASETNNSHFIVERSYNAKNFEEIGRLEGKGTTETESSYTFFDSKPLSGVSYYRLKQVDEPKKVNGNVVDGDATYSKIVSVTRETSKFLVVSPNPTADFATIELDAPVAIKSWSVIDVQGKIRKSNQTGLKVNLSDLATGEYIIEILTVNGDVYHKKIAKK